MRKEEKVVEEKRRAEKEKRRTGNKLYVAMVCPTFLAFLKLKYLDTNGSELWLKDVM